jgi:hypothetical protein
MHTIARIHAAPGAMKSLASPMTKSFWRITVPRLPISSSTTPFQASRPASVTTNDGTPILVMIRPCSVPIPRPAASTITIVSHVGSSLPSGVSSSAVSTPPTPDTKPIDRSISPSSSTNVTPMAMTAYGAVWTSRLTKLPDVRNRSFCVWKTIAMMIRPTTIGSEPRSPDLTPVHQLRAYAATVWLPPPVVSAGGGGAIVLMRRPPRRPRRAPWTACPP